MSPENNITTHRTTEELAAPELVKEVAEIREKVFDDFFGERVSEDKLLKLKEGALEALKIGEGEQVVAFLPQKINGKEVGYYSVSISGDPDKGECQVYVQQHNPTDDLKSVGMLGSDQEMFSIEPDEHLPLYQPIGSFGRVDEIAAKVVQEISGNGIIEPVDSWPEEYSAGFFDSGIYIQPRGKQSLDFVNAACECLDQNLFTKVTPEYHAKKNALKEKLNGEKRRESLDFEEPSPLRNILKNLDSESKISESDLENIRVALIEGIQRSDPILETFLDDVNCTTKYLSKFIEIATICSQHLYRIKYIPTDMYRLDILDFRGEAKPKIENILIDYFVDININMVNRRLENGYHDRPNTQYQIEFEKMSLEDAQGFMEEHEDDFRKILKDFIKPGGSMYPHVAIKKESTGYKVTHVSFSKKEVFEEKVIEV